jgi:hypothetical protein
LHFAKSEAVQALKAQIGELAANSNSPRPVTQPAPASVSSPSSGNTVMWWILGGGVLLMGVWALRSRQWVFRPR